MNLGIFKIIKVETLNTSSKESSYNVENKPKYENKKGRFRSTSKNHRFSIFHKNFMQLRKSLNLEKFPRRYQFDSLLKKVKNKVFKTIHNSIKKCFLECFRLQRLPQKFVINININLNKFYMTRTILEIYQEHDILSNLEKFDEEKIIKQKKKEVLIEFLSLTFKELYISYINSNQFIHDTDRISKKENEKYAKLYVFIAKNYLEYFTYTKANRPKKIKKRIFKPLFKVIPQKEILN